MSYDIVALLDLFSTLDLKTDRAVKLKRLSAGRCLCRSVAIAGIYVLPYLVYEDNGRTVLACQVDKLSQARRHKPCQLSYFCRRFTKGPVHLSLGHHSRHRVDDQKIYGIAQDKLLRHGKHLVRVVRLGKDKLLKFYPAAYSKLRVKRLFNVQKCRNSPVLLTCRY